MRLTKHHGLGNDFLIVLLDSEPADLPDLARTLCHRSRGIGADGLIVGLPDDDPNVDVVMVLYNSDGSRAEMSGNGIRCLAHAIALDRHAVDLSLHIRTDGGVRAVDVQGSGAVVAASVDMGSVGEGPGVPAELAAMIGETNVATADVGNPHLVIQVDTPHEVDVASVGSAYEGHFEEGMNVEFIAPTPGEDNALDFVVWERGAGVTEACGTGAVAAATRAAGWGLSSDEVTVHMPGGDVRVLVGERATLIGPSVLVGSIEWSGVA